MFQRVNSPRITVVGPMCERLLGTGFQNIDCSGKTLKFKMYCIIIKIIIIITNNIFIVLISFVLYEPKTWNKV